MLTLALPTGRSFGECVKILECSGLPVSGLKDAGRSLVIEEGAFRYILSKPSDVPAMVYYGAADLALAGNDVIEEAGITLAELLDTGLGRCRMAVAGPSEIAEKFRGGAQRLMGLKVATKYARLAERTFAGWGVQIKLLKLNGSVELAPALGLADCIFDVVQTGKTLEANGLSVIKETLPVSLRLVAGVSSIQLRWNSIFGVVGAVNSAVEAKKWKKG